MCGICGHTRDPDGTRVARMNAAMFLRGPDDEGSYCDARCGLSLGARRLSIIDVEGGHQPVANEDRTIWAAMNGEIYNHPELQRQLRASGHTLASGVDTEVLVHLYEGHGAGMVHALEGMYAFAVWDAPREELLIVRDRFGEKPLFYAEQNGNLIWASELDPLLAGLGTDPDLEPAAVDAFFVHGYVPGPTTLIKGVRQLPPGHLLRWNAHDRQVRIEPYWRPLPAGELPGEERFEGLVAETGRLLEASVRSRLVADVPLGVFLSGGLDSTLIAALAARVSSDPIKTFTVGYDVGTVSETAEAARTAMELGAEHHELILTQDELARRIPGLLAGMDQPLADQALVSLHAIAEHARRDVTVVVGGEGADELFGGYPRYRWLRRAELVRRRIPAPLAAGLAATARRTPHPRAARVADVLEPRTVLERHLDWVTAPRPTLRDELYGAALSGVSRDRVLGDLEARLNSHVAAPVMAQLMLLDQQHWLPDDVLVKADRAGMRVSMEIRTPYLNRELAEFAATVPDRVHAGRQGKALLRALLEQVAPEASRRRPKTAFRVPAADWLRGPLSSVLDQQLAEGRAFEEGWFDRAAAQRMVDQHRSGARDATPALWPLLAFGLWLDRVRA